MILGLMYFKASIWGNLKKDLSVRDGEVVTAAEGSPNPDRGGRLYLDKGARAHLTGKKVHMSKITNIICALPI